MTDDERAYQWLWAASMAAGIAALVLVALYYWRHRERSILTDFAPRPESSNGTHPLAPSDQGMEAVDLEP